MLEQPGEQRAGAECERTPQYARCQRAPYFGGRLAGVSRRREQRLDRYRRCGAEHVPQAEQQKAPELELPTDVEEELENAVPAERQRAAAGVLCQRVYGGHRWIVRGDMSGRQHDRGQQQ